MTIDQLTYRLAPSLRRLSLRCAAIAAVASPALAQLDANFTATPLSGTQPLSVSFTDTSTGAAQAFRSWDFGDGTTAIGPNPTHTYEVAETTSFTVTLTVLTATGSDVETKVDFITVDPAPLVVDFAASVTSGVNPLTVSFTDLTTGGAVTAWSWDFGDGNTSTLQNPTHTYEAGTATSFDVSLEVTLAVQKETGVKPGFITVDPAPLVVDFSADTTVGDPPLTVNFSNLSSGAAVTAWQWDFGDGGTSTVQDPTHLYALPGDYDVTLTAFVGPQVESLERAGFVSVNPIFALDANFQASPTAGDHPLRVVFTNLSTGDLITGFLWDFGDGNTSTDPDPVHEYFVTESASFDVTLTAFTGGQTSVDHRPGLIDVTFAFPEHTAVSGTSGPVTVLAADLDGDGARDLVAGSAGDSTVAWYENTDSLGSFGPQRPIDATAQNPVALDDADLDGDGDRDLLVVTGGDRRIAWYENTDGLGTFGPARPVVQYGSGAVLTTEAADLDGDGDQDVLTLEGWVPNTDGAGLFGAEVPIGLRPAMFYPADIDLDGDLDVFRVFDDTQMVPADGVDWWGNDGGGGFALVESIARFRGSGNFPAGDHAAADFNLDGAPDFVSIYLAFFYPHENRRPAVNSFEPLASGPIASCPIPGAIATLTADLELADVDGDGLVDLVAPLFYADRVAYRRNVAGLASVAPTRFVTANSVGPPEVTASDLDGDGDLDFVVPEAATNRIRWFENTQASPDWPNLGSGLAGELGNPILSGAGELAAGSDVSLTLTNARASSAAVLVVGFTRIDLPILGGTLVPSPDFKLKGLVTDRAGELAWDLVWPPGLAPGQTLYFQYWVSDPSAPEGLAASNGTSSTAPPVADD